MEVLNFLSFDLQPKYRTSVMSLWTFSEKLTQTESA